MSTDTFSQSDISEDDLFGSESSTASAVAEESLELEDSQLIEPDWEGDRCEKCTAPIQSEQMAICRNCGWYASLGTFMEVDHEWEEATDEQAADEDKPQPSHLEVWMNLLPWYAWVVVASVLVVVIMSVAVRLVFASSVIRVHWSIAQLMIGAGVFAVCHILYYIRLASFDSDTGMLDFVMKPLKIWLNAARELPNKLAFFDAGVCGLTAVVMSLAVIGALPYDRLLDWGFEERPEANLMGAVMNQAKKAKEEDMTMEEAINDLTDKAGVDDLGDDDAKPKLPEPEIRQNIDCVILGYRTNQEGVVHTLILAAEQNGKLRYAGRVEPELSEKENRKLLAALEIAKTKKPFVPIQLSASWVTPKFTCRVSYTKRSKDGRLEQVEWGKMLSQLKLRKRK